MNAIEPVEVEENIEVNPPYDAAESVRRYEEKMNFLASIQQELAEPIEALRKRTDFDGPNWVADIV